MKLIDFQQNKDLSWTFLFEDGREIIFSENWAGLGFWGRVVDWLEEKGFKTIRSDWPSWHPLQGEWYNFFWNQKAKEHETSS